MAWFHGRAILGAVNERREDHRGIGSQKAHCPVCDESPVVLMALRHPVMRAWTDELLATEHGCWTVMQPRADEMLMDAIRRTEPDLVVVDSSDFPACCQAALDALPSDRVIVIGPEPNPAYRSMALAQGAGGWVCRDQIGEDLSVAMRTSLGCAHAPCPVPPSCAPPPTPRAAQTGDPTR